jgi:hypothetical protein
MDGAVIDLTFRRGDQGAEQLQEVIDEVLAELADPSSEAAEAARAAGMDVEEMSGVAVQVREDAQGAVPFLTEILIGIAINAGTKAAEKLWTQVLWPRVKRRLGTRALGEATSGSGEDPGS